VGDVQHCVHHAAQVVGVPAAALAWRVEHRLQQAPLLIGQITWYGMLRTMTTRLVRATSGGCLRRAAQEHIIRGVIG
jgi:hypothetical protein